MISHGFTDLKIVQWFLDFQKEKWHDSSLQSALWMDSRCLCAFPLNTDLNSHAIHSLLSKRPQKSLFRLLAQSNCSGDGGSCLPGDFVTFAGRFFLWRAGIARVGTGGWPILQRSCHSQVHSSPFTCKSCIKSFNVGQGPSMSFLCIISIMSITVKDVEESYSPNPTLGTSCHSARGTSRHLTAPGRLRSVDGFPGLLCAAGHLHVQLRRCMGQLQEVHQVPWQGQHLMTRNDEIRMR